MPLSSACVDTTPSALYVHWPFCRRICPYCDFNVRREQPEQIKAMADAIIADIHNEALWQQQYAPNRELQAIHFGGGTPSMMPVTLIQDIIALVQIVFPCVETLEIALEANPEDYPLYNTLQESGINRLTLGIQALDDQRLCMLGRGHDCSTALRAIETATKIYHNVAGDFIYASSNQTPAQWQQELERIVDLGLQHISLYALTIEPATVFGKRPPPGLPHDDLAADMMLISENVCHAGGYPQYEVSNFAPTPYRSVYNSGVWRSWDFIGVGPGAWGRHVDQDLQRHARRKLVAPNDYLRMIPSAHRTLDDWCANQEKLDHHSAAQEWLLMQLRLCEGVDLACPPTFIKYFLLDMTLVHRALQDWCEADLLTINHTTLVPTQTGRLQLDRLGAAVYHAIEPLLYTSSATR